MPPVHYRPITFPRFVRWALACLLALWSLGTAVSAAEAVAVDPMVWKPGKMPELRTLLDQDAYKERAAKVLAGIDKKALESCTRPTDAVKITSFVEDSQALGLGLHRGYLLISLDGVAVPSAASWNSMRTEKPQQLVVWSDSEGESMVTIQPGKMGTYLGMSWRPDLAYLRLKSGRDPKWDDDMLVAATVYATDPDLAETALARAQKAGCKSHLVLSLATCVAVSQCRFAQALDLGQGALPLAPKPEQRPILQAMLDAALVDYRYELALQILHDHEVVQEQSTLTDHLQAAVAAHHALSVDQRVVINPLAAAATMPRHDATDELVPHPCFGYDSAPAMLDQLTKTSELHFKNPPHIMIVGGFGPTAADVELTADLFFTANGDLEAAYGVRYEFNIGIFDFAGQEKTAQLEAEMGADGTVNIYQGSIQRPVELATTFPVSETNPIHFQLAVVGPNCEVAVNGQRIGYASFLAPSATRQLGFYFQMVGTKGHVGKLKWTLLGETQVKPPPSGGGF